MRSRSWVRIPAVTLTFVLLAAAGFVPARAGIG
jgi:hypothetical protein